MKIVAGLSYIEDYIRLVKAGADEVFAGYVPYEWTAEYGNLFPLNRRECIYFNSQIRSLSDMKILKKMSDVYHVPVSITFNNLYYTEVQYKLIGKIIKELIDTGFEKFIISDIGLMIYLKQNNINCSIHLSGECAETNHCSIDFFNKFNIKRYIFNRKNSIEDIASCISYSEKNCQSAGKETEFEAFVLNERCHYTGAFCSSFHCDEMIHLCEMPFNMGKVDGDSYHFPKTDSKIEAYYESCEKVQKSDNNKYMLGATGCGLCSLKRLELAGVTHLKVVGRGNSIDNIESDVQYLKKAIGMLNETDSPEEYQSIIKNEIFNGKCSGHCYFDTCQEKDKKIITQYI
ncbi:U32 family peptidase [uncultured Clostridium sp.]|uniref:U32 family peptidase n=1 Tax=uncultured Clostridium sp. TaxID=59620 RepID=UPI0025D100E4|nr:U32 family peptidase [uncultured Clostridium sp.]